MSAEPSDTDRELEELGQQTRKLAEHHEKFFPYDKLISISDALPIAEHIASRLKVTGYKTEKLLARALRAKQLTTIFHP